MSTARILLAEDEEIMATVIQQTLQDDGFDVVLVQDGQAAWDLLRSGDTAFELFLLDWEMPRMDGMQLLQKLKSESRFASVPVVMQTVFSDAASIQAGLDAGAYYYLTKPFLPRVLLSIVKAALEQYHDLQRMIASVRQAQRPFALLDHGVFRFRTLDESVLLADFFAHACPDPESAVLGLRELLINAVEHGNLGISYQEKSHLMHSASWHEEIAHRLSLPQNADKWAEVRFRRTASSIEFTIRDQGQGFEWERYLDFDPARVFDLNGRGIAMARFKSFDSLEYAGNGNTVIATVSLSAAEPSDGAHPD